MNEQANSFKQKGNDYFKRKQYVEAVEMYSSALTYDALDPVLYANRAMAYIKLHRSENAKLDCDAALNIDPNHIKALYRRGIAFINMGLMLNACNDFEHILRIQPNNVDAIKELNTIQRLLQNNNQNQSIIELKSVDKVDMLRSKQPMKRIPIEIVDEKIQINNQITEKQNKLLEPSIDLPPPAITAYQFIIDHRRLEQHPILFARYFMQLAIDNYVTILGDIIDYDIISHLLIGLDQYINQSSSVNLCIDGDLLDRLMALTLVPGFELAILFIGDNEKKALNSILTHCYSNDQEFIINTIRNSFDINIY